MKHASALLRPLAAVLLAATLVAGCSREPAQPVRPTPVEGLATWTVPVATPGTARAWDGTVQAVREALISAQTSGRVAEVLHDVDDRVEAGSLLLRLSVVEQQAAVDAARAGLRAAEAAAAEAEATWRRYEALAGDHFVSRAQLDQVQAARHSALAARDAARAQLASARQQQDYTRVRAPYDGVVSRRLVEVGEAVAPGQPLIAVFAPDALRIEVAIPQGEAARVRAEPHADVRFADGSEVLAVPVIVYPAADPASHAVRVRINLPAGGPLPRPGETARVAFPGVTTPALPRIPAAAVLRRGELRGAYVLAEGRLSLRQLRLGEETGGMVEVIAGLAPGETLALDPVAAVQALTAARAGAR